MIDAETMLNWYDPEKTEAEMAAERRKLAAEAKAIMEQRWNQPGVADWRKPCTWYSERYGNPRCGYKLEMK
jgi:hypothetical protein